MGAVARGKMIDRAREILRRAGRRGAEIVETTPKLGGLRRRAVQWLVDGGEAEWVVAGRHARLKNPDAPGAVTWHRYAPFALADDYVMLGWLPHEATLLGSPHGSYRLHVEWVCCCGRRPAEPAEERRRAGR